eukprot:1128052-Pyramimonas_sp.AAC.1
MSSGVSRNNAAATRAGPTGQSETCITTKSGEPVSVMADVTSFRNAATSWQNHDGRERSARSPE